MVEINQSRPFRTVSFVTKLEVKLLMKEDFVSTLLINKKNYLIYNKKLKYERIH